MKKRTSLLIIFLFILLLAPTYVKAETTYSCPDGYELWEDYGGNKKCRKYVGGANYFDFSWNCTAHPGTNVIDTKCYEVIEATKIENDTNNDNKPNNDNTSNDTTNNKPTNPDVEELKNKFLGNYTCGGIQSFTFPKMLPDITSLVYNLIKIAIPILLIIKGMMDMFKASTAGKEDEMKKAQNKFVQRLIAGICAFLVFIIVETVINLIADKTNNSNAMNCVDCFINGSKNCSQVISKNANQTAASKFFVPFKKGTKYKVTSNYGNRILNNKNEYHHGIDLVGVSDKTIVAAADGTVYSAGTSNSMGTYAKIKHTINGNVYYTTYMHMEAGSLKVTKNQTIKARQAIGIMGNTGDSQGAHLHFQINKENGDSVNPNDFIKLPTKGNTATA